jgi:epoxide hydrolase-like predicted phosphatase
MADPTSASSGDGVVIDAVLFDFGGVFTTSPFEALRAVADEIGADFDEAMGVVFGSYDTDSDHVWHQVERGELALEVAHQAVIDEATGKGYDLDLYQVLQRMGGGGVRDDVVEHVRAVRVSGRQTAIVTHNAAEFRDLWRPLLPLDELFDVVIDSSEVGVRKPDPRIYHLTLEHLGGLAPERALFLDDFVGNVEAARALGMHGIVVGPDHEPAMAELRALLDLPA